MEFSENQEQNNYLQSQLITYIGNKRALLEFIGQGVQIVQKKLGKEKLDCLDIFAGSGIVSRYLKQFSSSITTNDLETYSCIINRCYLANLTENELKDLHKYYDLLNSSINKRMEELEHSRKNNTYKAPGFISQYYAPNNQDSILREERCFYTPYNANYLDVARQEIDKQVPEKYRDFFIAPLLSEASIHANTAGIFKGFYKNSKTKTGQFGGNGKNALSRILGKITLPFPVFSEHKCPFRVFNENANDLVNNNELGSFDLAYFDPPYNQHPYGSNYFMLNLIANYKTPDPEKMSRVSGIPSDWNRSAYNKRGKVAEVFIDLVQKVKARFVLISFNSEGFISREEMTSLLESCGKVTVLEAKYNTFRGSRNLKDRDVHVKEYLYLVEKN
ncbi:MAG: DNA adenine methylase [Treponema sp.]|nr:DNA adenine methylase [Treponema sp.]